MRPLLLDLFSGAGGAAMGYHRAGFDVVGVDLAPQPRYPFRFVQGDAVAFLRSGAIEDLEALLGQPVAAIHASPPCQLYSTMRRGLWKEREHPNLIPPTRAELHRLGLPYVIENVEGARRELVDPIKLCGTMFGLGVEESQLRRHRYFEVGSFGLWPPGPCAHNRAPTVPVYGGGQDKDYHNPPRRPRTIGVWGSAGGSSKRDGLVQFSTAVRRQAMGIDWMTGEELSESIPPAYTEHIGRALLEALR